jgi:hypothetical protein
MREAVAAFNRIRREVGLKGVGFLAIVVVEVFKKSLILVSIKLDNEAGRIYRRTRVYDHRVR